MPELLAWIAKSRLKQGKNSLEIARFGNLAKPKDNFSEFSDNLLAPKGGGFDRFCSRKLSADSWMNIRGSARENELR